VPTYSYRCTECGTAFDIQQAFTDDSLTVCPTCGGVLRKVFSPVGVTFSGSGFYRTDSRASGSGAAEKSGESKAAAPAGDSGGSSTATPAAPTTSSSSSSGSSTT
jgi:putative FmdB family regulatory protein